METALYDLFGRPDRALLALRAVENHVLAIAASRSSKLAMRISKYLSPVAKKLFLADIKSAKSVLNSDVHLAQSQLLKIFNVTEVK